MIGVEYNGSHSYDDFNIEFVSIQRPILPALNKREVTIPGKHGTYDFGGNTYGTKIIMAVMQYIGTSFEDLRLEVRNIAAWLSQTSYKKLIFDDEPSVYYLAKVYGGVDMDSLLFYGKSSIQFECQPFALYTESTGTDLAWGDDVSWGSEYVWNNPDAYTIPLLTAESTKTATVVYNGNAELGLGAEQGAQFNIIVTGTFTVFSISMNGKTLIYTENCTDQTITIDNVNATVKNGATNKLFNVTGDVGEFLKLTPGDNVIVISKTGGNIDFLFDFLPQFI